IALPVGNGSTPTSDEEGPVSIHGDGNSNNNPGTVVIGKNNYVPAGAKSKLIVGDNSSVARDVEGAIVFGDNITATEPNTIYIGNIKINEQGIQASGINIIDGGLNTVFPFDKTNPVDIIDGGFNSVRNPDGDIKLLPIIDGNGAF